MVERSDQLGSPTLTTVAAEAGVSRQTVSNAINNPSLLSPQTLRRVRQAIDELGYLPNLAARQLRTRSSRMIGLRVDPAPTALAGLMERFVHALARACADTGHYVMLFTGDPEDPVDGYDELLGSTAVDAFVVADTASGASPCAHLEERGVPFVALGRPWGEPEAGHPWVDVDGRVGVRLATEHVLAQGHRNVAWLGGEAGDVISDERRAGWAEAAGGDAVGAEDVGIEPAEVGPAEVGPVEVGPVEMASTAPATDELSFHCRNDVGSARACAARALDAGATGVVCVNDTVALGCLQAVRDRGLIPGRDVATTGFGDSAMATAASPGLTSVRAPVEQAAVVLVASLHKVLSGLPLSQPGTMLTPRLVVRGSSTAG